MASIDLRDAQGKKVGSFGRAGAFSFYPSKNLTVMGDGGLLVTEEDEVAARCRRLRDHGRSSSAGSSLAAVISSATRSW